MASDPRPCRPRRRRPRCAPALFLLLAGCKLLAPEIFDGDDCSPVGSRPIHVELETSEGPVTFQRGQILISAASDVEDCYTGISLRFEDEDLPNKCWMEISVPATAAGVGEAWDIDRIAFVMRNYNGDPCRVAPAPVRESYTWDRMSVGGTVRILPPETSSSRDGGGRCFREGLELTLNARMVLAGGPLNPDAVKEFWFTENTYFIDEPLPVVEVFDCPF